MILNLQSFLCLHVKVSDKSHPSTNISMTLIHFFNTIRSEDLLPYFFGYKTEFFSDQTNPKNLDPSCKMDLDLWGCLRRAKLVS